MRRLICTNCYYYGRWCYIGWGKLAALLYRQGSVDRFRSGIGIRVAAVTYGLLSLLPPVLVVVALAQTFSVVKLVVLALFLLVLLYILIPGRNKTCGNCETRLICPGGGAR